MIGHLLPRGREVHLGETGFIEFQQEVAQVLPGEVARAGDDGDERGEFVALGIDEFRERLEVVLGLAGIAVAALCDDERIGMIGDEDGDAERWALAVEDFAEVGILREPGCDFRERHGAELLRKVGGRHSRPRLEIPRCRLGEVAFLAMELRDKLVAHGGEGVVRGDGRDLADELGKRDAGIDNHGFHRGDFFQGLVNAHGVEDAEGFLFHIVAKAGGAANHLVEEDAAVHAAKENDVANRRNVHAGREQIYGDCDGGIVLVFETADEL